MLSLLVLVCPYLILLLIALQLIMLRLLPLRRIILMWLEIGCRPIIGLVILILCILVHLAGSMLYLIVSVVFVALVLLVGICWANLLTTCYIRSEPPKQAK